MVPREADPSACVSGARRGIGAVVVGLLQVSTRTSDVGTRASREVVAGVGGGLLIAGVLGIDTPMLTPLQHGLRPSRAIRFDLPAAAHAPPGTVCNNLDHLQAIACSALLLLGFELMPARSGRSHVSRVPKASRQSVT